MRRVLLKVSIVVVLLWVSAHAQGIDQVNRQHPLARGLYAWYPVLPHLSGGRDWWDLSGQIHGRTENMSTAGVGWVPMSSGRFAGAMRFHGAASTGIRLADTPLDFEHTQPFSLCVWLRLPPTTTPQELVSKFPNSGAVEGWGFYVTDAGEMALYLGDISGNYILQKTVETVDDNVWHHVAVTYPGDALAANIRHYTNGVARTPILDSVGTLSATILNDLDAYIGGNAGEPTNYFTGELSDLRIYTRVLSQAEVGAIAQATAPTYGGLLVDEEGLGIATAARIKRRVTIE